MAHDPDGCIFCAAGVPLADGRLTADVLDPITNAKTGQQVTFSPGLTAKLLEVANTLNVPTSKNSHVGRRQARKGSR